MDEHEYDGDSIGIVRVGTVELTQVAETGTEGTGSLVLDDAAGNQPIIGQKDWTVTEADCVNTHTYSGFVDDREFSRAGGEAKERYPDARVTTVQLTDINNYLSQTGITGSDGNRTDSDETVDQRLAWLTGSAYWPAAVTIGTRVASSSIELDKADYRQQQPGDVLADLATATGFNYYVADWGSGPELTFRDDNTSTDDSSDVRISNDPADVDSDHATVGASKVFAPSMDFKLSRSPQEVYSDMSLSYAKGTMTDDLPATASAFNGVRYGTASTSNIKSSALASDALGRLLNVHSTERDFLNGSILVPSSAVNLLRQGERLQVKFTELANTGGRDYDAWTWCRVMERTVRPLKAEIPVYELRLRLSPQEVPPAPEICDDLYAPTPSGTFYPLGGVNTTPGAHPFASDGVVHYWRGGLGIPNVPDLHEIGSWHFGEWGAGGLGTIDWAGDCTGNWLILITVGNGEWTIQTEAYGGSSRALEVKMGPELSSAPHHSYINSGDSVVVTIDDTTDGDCIRSTVITDRGLACGGKWGWSEGVWGAA